MLATRWEPFGDIHRLEQHMNRLFNRWDKPSVADSRLPLNLWEDDEHLYVEAELPGVALEDLEIQVEGNQLSLKVERKQVDREGTWHRLERSYGVFERVLELPRDVDTGKVTATLRDGVLSVTLPRRESAKVRRIEVNGG